MNSLKGVFSFLGLFVLLSTPILVFYKTPQVHKAQMRLVKPYRGIASVVKPATKSCEWIQRVRWQCEKDKDGKKKCHRHGFDKVRHCKPL